MILRRPLQVKCTDATGPPENAASKPLHNRGIVHIRSVYKSSRFTSSTLSTSLAGSFGHGEESAAQRISGGEKGTGVVAGSAVTSPPSSKMFLSQGSQRKAFGESVFPAGWQLENDVARARLRLPNSASTIASVSRRFDERAKPGCPVKECCNEATVRCDRLARRKVVCFSMHRGRCRQSR